MSGVSGPRERARGDVSRRGGARGRRARAASSFGTSQGSTSSAAAAIHSPGEMPDCHRMPVSPPLIDSARRRFCSISPPST
ncbi:hypothetical protein [Halomonas sp. THAF5a]|uniref:hypothetical protein n=1 Tax=Halomonas sp. THAF5a TaxID=2587844 RepID=UPI0012695B27|nr:hypothetical protein [Halomonas sp. THAF5a]